MLYGFRGLLSIANQMEAHIHSSNEGEIHPLRGYLKKIIVKINKLKINKRKKMLLMGRIQCESFGRVCLEFGFALTGEGNPICSAAILQLKSCSGGKYSNWFCSVTIGISSTRQNKNYSNSDGLIIFK